MDTAQIIFIAISFLLSIISFFIAFRQYKEKGFLLNNTFIYASKEERRRMNKKPYYRQSAIAFAIIGIMFFVTALMTITNLDWLSFVLIGLVMIAIIYAIVSSVLMGRKGR